MALQGRGRCVWEGQTNGGSGGGDPLSISRECAPSGKKSRDGRNGCLAPPSSAARGQHGGQTHSVAVVATACGGPERKDAPPQQQRDQGAQQGARLGRRREPLVGGSRAMRRDSMCGLLSDILLCLAGCAQDPGEAANRRTTGGGSHSGASECTIPLPRLFSNLAIPRQPRLVSQSPKCEATRIRVCLNWPRTWCGHGRARSTRSGRRRRRSVSGERWPTQEMRADGPSPLQPRLHLHLLPRLLLHHHQPNHP